MSSRTWTIEVKLTDFKHNLCKVKLRLPGVLEGTWLVERKGSFACVKILSFVIYAEGTKTQKLGCVKLWYMVVFRFIEVLLFLPGFFLYPLLLA